MPRFRIIGALLLLAGCTSGDGTGPENVAKIVVTPGQATLTSVGATQQFTAQAQSAGGGTVPGAVVTWRSSNAAIVRVEGNGLATAVAEGTASVVAESSGVSGQADVLVDVPDCTSPQTVTLQPGQVLVADPPANASCALTLPSGLPGTRYRVAIVRLGSAQDATQVPSATLRLTARGIIATPPPAAVQEAPLPPLFDARQMELLARSNAMAEATHRAHLRLRSAEEELIRRVMPYERVAPSALATDGPFPVSPAKRTFLPRLPTDTQCQPAKPAVTGILIAQNADVAVYQDSTEAQTAAISVANAQTMIDFYTRHGKATIESYFGAIPDRDNNSQVVVFATPDVSGQIAAFVWGGDQLPRSGSSPCPASNEAELVYFNTGLIQQLDDNQPNFQALETLVHEVKHVVSFSQRVTGAIFNTHPTWIEEGSAEIAGEAASRRAWAAAGGPAQNGVVTRQSFTGSFTPENYGIALRLTRTRSYLAAQPNAVVVATSSAYSIYGSGWHFHRFLGDGYGGAGSSGGADASLFRQQNTASTPAGLGGFPIFTGKNYEALLPEYAAAIMLSGTGAPAPARAFTTYDFPSAISAFSGGPAAPYPYPVTAVGSNPSASFATNTWTGQIGNGGIRIHDFVSNGTGTGTDITVQVEAPARVVVVRIR
jgi:hypothetical protein